MSEREPTWRVRVDVAWTDEAPRFVAMALSRPEMQPVSLEGPAALIWQAVSEGAGGESAVVARVAELAGVSPEVVAGDVVAFLLELESLGLASSDGRDVGDLDGV